MTLLSRIRNTREDRPPKLCIYGPEGCGKSTFAAASENPIFHAPENGLAELDAKAFPTPESFAGVLSDIDELITADHPFQTYVIDSIDWLEPLIWNAVCKKNGWEDIESPGYGKGYTAALELWRQLLSRLEMLQEKRNMGVILIAHAQIKNYADPSGDGWNRYQLKLNPQASALVTEWVSELLFATFEEMAHKDKNKRIRGVSDGSRVVYTERRAWCAAKNRHGLPFQMPLDWQTIRNALRAPGDPSDLMAEVERLMPKLEADNQTRAREAIERTGGDAWRLAKLVAWMKERQV